MISESKLSNGTKRKRGSLNAGWLRTRMAADDEAKLSSNAGWLRTRMAADDEAKLSLNAGWLQTMRLR